MPGPELTADTTGNPYVEVYFDPADLDGDTHTIRMYRFSDERQWLVRGGVDVVPGTAAIDYEVPFQTTAQYRAEQFAVDGTSLGFTDASSIVVDFEGTVVHQPLVPTTLWAVVTVLAESAKSLVRSTPGSLAYPEDSVAGTWVGARRQGLRQVPVSLMTETLADANQLQAMLGTYETQQLGVLCIRSSLGIRWPKTFFARGDLSEVSLNVNLGGTAVRFDSSMDEVKPPHPGITTPLLTYSDMSVAFDTYTALSAAIATYTLSSRSYEYAGLAG